MLQEAVTEGILKKKASNAKDVEHTRGTQCVHTLRQGNENRTSKTKNIH